MLLLRLKTRATRSRAAAVLAVVAVIAAGGGAANAASGSAVSARAARICNSHLRVWDGTDVFALSASEVLAMAKALGDTELRLRRALPSRTWSSTRPVRLSLRKAAHLGRVYSRAYRADPSDNSLPQEAAFENSLLDLRRTASHAGLRACSIRLATP